MAIQITKGARLQLSVDCLSTIMTKRTNPCLWWILPRTIQNAYCRNNVYGGISLVGSAATTEGGVGSQIIVMNCISEGNTNNYYVTGDTESYENKGIFINCVSLNASGAGYKTGDNARMILINCSDSGSTLVKDGTITVQNADIVQ